MQWRWSYLALIRPATVIKSATRRSGTAKVLRSRRRAHAGPGNRRRAASSDRDIPGPACIFCIIHASSRAVLDVIAISSPGLRQTPLRACAARSRASQWKLHHEPPLRCASRQIQATRRLYFAGSCLLRGCPAHTYVLCGNALGRCFNAGGFRCVLQMAGLKRLLSSTQLPHVFATAH